MSCHLWSSIKVLPGRGFNSWVQKSNNEKRWKFSKHSLMQVRHNLSHKNYDLARITALGVQKNWKAAKFMRGGNNCVFLNLQEKKIRAWRLFEYVVNFICCLSYCLATLVSHLWIKITTRLLLASFCPFPFSLRNLIFRLIVSPLPTGLLGVVLRTSGSATEVQPGHF